MSHVQSHVPLFCNSLLFAIIALPKRQRSLSLLSFTVTFYFVPFAMSIHSEASQEACPLPFPHPQHTPSHEAFRALKRARLLRKPWAVSSQVLFQDRDKNYSLAKGFLKISLYCIYRGGQFAVCPKTAARFAPE